jgi:hypothetical protein
VGGSPNVLLISSYKEDTHTLLRIVETLGRVRDLRPISLLPVFGPQREGALQVVHGAGIEVFEDLCEKDTEVHGPTYNPFYRAHVVRKAYLKLSERILKRTEPTAILCTSSFLGGHFLRAASARGIRSLYVLWTHVGPPEFHRAWWRAEQRYRDAQQPFLGRLRRRARRALYGVAGLGQRWPLHVPATSLALPGPYYREQCIRAGVPANRLEVTGNVQCDDMHRYACLDTTALAEIKRSLGVAGDQQYMLYAATHEARLACLAPSTASSALAASLAAMRAAFPSFARVVKLHPKQGEADFARIRSADPAAIVVREEPTIGQLIAAAAVVVSPASSSLLWAVGIDRPAISAHLWEGVDEWKQLIRGWDGVERADSYESLVAAIRNNVENADHMATWRRRRAACREAFMVIDGRSVERIVSKFCSYLS